MDEYSASPLEQLVPSRLSRWVLVALLPSTAAVAGFVVNYADRVAPSLSTGEQNLCAALAALTVLLILSWVMLVDLALLFKAKRHSRVIHHHAKNKP